MSDNNPAQPASSQRIKLALIPVLALGLAAVLFWPTNEAPEAAQALPRAPLPVFPAAAGNAPTAGNSHRHVWRPVNLDEVISFNPFARGERIDALFRPEPIMASQPVESPVAQVPTTSTVAAPPPQRIVTLVNVQAILQTGGAAAALIDGQIVRAGDTLKDGTKIVAITPEGVQIDGGK